MIVLNKSIVHSINKSFWKLVVLIILIILITSIIPIFRPSFELDFAHHAWQDRCAAIA